MVPKEYNECPSQERLQAAIKATEDVSSYLLYVINTEKGIKQSIVDSYMSLQSIGLEQILNPHSDNPIQEKLVRDLSKILQTNQIYIDAEKKYSEEYAEVIEFLPQIKHQKGIFFWLHSSIQIRQKVWHCLLEMEKLAQISAEMDIVGAKLSFLNIILSCDEVADPWQDFLQNSEQYYKTLKDVVNATDIDSALDIWKQQVKSESSGNVEWEELTPEDLERAGIENEAVSDTHSNSPGFEFQDKTEEISSISDESHIDRANEVVRKLHADVASLNATANMRLAHCFTPSLNETSGANTAETVTIGQKMSVADVESDGKDSTDDDADVSAIDVELYNRLSAEKIKEKLITLDHISSERYIAFLSSFLSLKKYPSDPTENRMVNMLYYSLYDSLPEDKGYSTVSDFQKYLDDIGGAFTEFITQLVAGNNCEKLEPLCATSLDIHALYSKEEILAGIGYWTWERRIPVREDVLYLPDKNTDCVFITLNVNSNSLVDNTHIIWELPGRYSWDSLLVKRILDSDDQSHLSFIFICEKNKTKTKLYYPLGEATAVKREINGSSVIEWSLQTPVSSKIEKTFVPKEEVEPIKESRKREIINPDEDLPEEDSVVMPQELTPEEISCAHLLKTTIKKDKMRSTYKYSLLYSVVEACQEYTSYVEAAEDDPYRVSMPIGFLVWKWMIYYYPIFANGDFVTIMYGEESPLYPRGRKIQFRETFKDIIGYYESTGGVTQFNEDLLYGNIPQSLQDSVFKLIKEIRDVIVTGPMKFFGNWFYAPSEYAIFEPIKQEHRMRSYESIDVDYIVHNCGRFLMTKSMFTLLSGVSGKSFILDSDVVNLWALFISNIDQNSELTIIEIKKLLPLENRYET